MREINRYDSGGPHTDSVWNARRRWSKHSTDSWHQRTTGSTTFGQCAPFLPRAFVSKLSLPLSLAPFRIALLPLDNLCIHTWTLFCRLHSNTVPPLSWYGRNICSPDRLRNAVQVPHPFRKVDVPYLVIMTKNNNSVGGLEREIIEKIREILPSSSASSLGNSASVNMHTKSSSRSPIWFSMRL